VSISIGQTLLNQYRVDAFIASGGMGAVYKVWDLKRNVPLAMKVLHSDLAEDPSMFKRFQREANALKKLAHPNIVPFYGLFQTLDFAFLLEHYIDGPSLKNILKQKQGKPMEVREALPYLKALCAALGYAHSYRVVHCDVKPGNVLIDHGGIVFLTDFGIARNAESTTTTMGAAGTAAYMAPEQIRGEAVSPATDVYALGVMLFEMLTGQRPFRGTEEGTEKGGVTANERIRYGQLYLVPPNPSLLNPGLSDFLAKVILVALAKDPSKRYAGAQEFFQAVSTVMGVDVDEIADHVAAPQASAQSARVPVTPLQGDRANAAGSVPSEGEGRAQVVTGILVTLKGLAKQKQMRILMPLLIITVSIIALVLTNQGGSKTNVGQPFFTGTITLTLLGSHPIIATRTMSSASPTATSSSTPIPTQTSLPLVTPIAIRVNQKDEAEIVFIPEGEFLMGSNPANDPYFWGAEQPEHTVSLDAFWIYQTEVTQGMYAACVAEQACPKPILINNPIAKEYGDPAFVDYPVTMVTWTSALAYCQWAGGRLPTEAEWEKAARGTDGRLFPWGNDPDTTNRSFYNSSSPKKVGSFPAGASPYGAYDMAGNVLEWVSDYFSSTYYRISPTTNPKGPGPTSTKVIRGGAYSQPDFTGLRTVARAGYRPQDGDITIGFRCVIDEP
jgi:formylglycine-generating enzyme required for sulfatase activity